MSRVIRIALAVMLAVAGLQADEVLDNAAVVKMVRAGLSPEVIELKVKSSAGRYDVTADGLIALKNAGVPDSVMAAMLRKSDAAKQATEAAAPVAAAASATAKVSTAASPAAPAAPATPAAPAAAAVSSVPAAASAPADDGQPVCARLAVEQGGKNAKRIASRVCVEADALTIDQQRVPFTSLTAHCRERSIGFPYTSDPDEWRFSDGRQSWRVFGSEREMMPLVTAAANRAAAIPYGACSSREMQKLLPLK